jgi:hypothetical protein
MLTLILVTYDNIVMRFILYLHYSKHDFILGIFLFFLYKIDEPLNIFSIYYGKKRLCQNSNQNKCSCTTQINSFWYFQHDL